MKAYAYLAAGVAALLGFLTLMFGAKKAGKDAAKAETQEKVIEKTTAAKRARRGATRKRMSRFDRK